MNPTCLVLIDKFSLTVKYLGLFFFFFLFSENLEFLILSRINLFVCDIL